MVAWHFRLSALRAVWLAGVAGPPKAHVLNASQLRMAQHTVQIVQYHFSIISVSCVSSIFRRVSAHFIIFHMLSLLDARLQRYKGRFCSSQVCLQNSPCHSDSSKDGTIGKVSSPRTWRLQTGLGGHNLDCGNIQGMQCSNLRTERGFVPDCPALPHLEDDEARFLCKIIYTDHTRYHRSTQ